jgi:peptide-methionine (R)-S-oxide reductase
VLLCIPYFSNFSSSEKNNFITTPAKEGWTVLDSIHRPVTIFHRRLSHLVARRSFNTETSPRFAFSLFKTLFPTPKPFPEQDPMTTTSTASPSDNNSAKKTEAEWKDTLTDAEYYVLRQKGTEPAGTGKLNKFYPKKGEGYFSCAACGNALYSTSAKFDSGCGWPAFDKCYTGSVKTDVDDSLGVRRIEIMCNACDGHLGHVFEGERFTATNERHCVNSISIKFVKNNLPEKVEEEALCPNL